jgi:hypothetical protein
MEDEMAKVIEEVIVIKLSRMVKDNSSDSDVIPAEQRKLIEDTIPTLIDEVIDDKTIVVEVADLG